jgi:hypothetical protein
MIARNLLPAGLHSTIDFPPGLRVRLRHSCYLSSQKALPHHFRWGFNPDQDEFGPGSFGSAVEIFSMMLQKIRGIENHGYSLPQKLFDENMASREKSLVLLFVILRSRKQDSSQSVACQDEKRQTISQFSTEERLTRAWQPTHHYKRRIHSGLR